MKKSQKNQSPKQGLKNKNKNKSKKGKKIVNIQGQPRHRDTPSGKHLKFLNSFGALVCSLKRQDITTKQLGAFKKRLTYKKMRQDFRHRCQPYLQLTKKPSEVRMGKGHGVKINRTVNPLIYGSAIGEVHVPVNFRHAQVYGESVPILFVAGLKKLPPFYRIMKCDI